MTEPIYVPVLPARRDAWSAYEALDDHVRRRIAPLWTLIPHTGRERRRGDRAAPDADSDQAALQRWLTSRTDLLIEATADGSGWVDAAHVEASVTGSAVGLWRLMTRSRLRIVTGPERHPTLQRYAADLAFLSGRGIGIRVLVDTPPDEFRSTELLDLVRRLALPPSHIDLILDLGAITDPEQAGKTGVAALDVLGGLAPWRTLVMTSGAFPRLHEHPGREAVFVVPRHDFFLHETVRAARPEFSRRLVYGDYATEHPFSANIPHLRDQGPPWGLMRYTTPDAFLVGRVPTRGGTDRIDRVRAMARRITRAEAFRGREFGEGERWLHDCAHGEGRKGSGNAETWIRIGHLQHLDFAVRQLRDAVA